MTTDMSRTDDGLDESKRLEDVTKSRRVYVSRIIDVKVEVAREYNIRTEDIESFEQRREFGVEQFTHRLTARTVDGDRHELRTRRRQHSTDEFKCRRREVNIQFSRLQTLLLDDRNTAANIAGRSSRLAAKSQRTSSVKATVARWSNTTNSDVIIARMPRLSNHKTYWSLIAIISTNDADLFLTE